MKSDLKKFVIITLPQAKYTVLENYLIKFPNVILELGHIMNDFYNQQNPGYKAVGFKMMDFPFLYTYRDHGIFEKK